MTLRLSIADLNPTISPRDVLYPNYERHATGRDYFVSALLQLVELDELLVASGTSLAAQRSVVDYACHYGRLARALRIALPGARIVAADVNADAVAFCHETLGCEPLALPGDPEAVPAAAEHDLILCSSLLTHTSYATLERTLALWERMLAPGGALVFTYLGAAFVDPWVEGKLDHYLWVEPDVRAEAARRFRRDGHTFVDLRGEQIGDYGMGFVADAFLGQAVGRRSTLRLVELRAAPANTFGQDLAVVRKSG